MDKTSIACQPLRVDHGTRLNKGYDGHQCVKALGIAITVVTFTSIPKAAQITVLTDSV